MEDSTILFGCHKLRKEASHQTGYGSTRRTGIKTNHKFYALLLAHYALCRLRVQAAHSRGLDPDRISFTGTIQLLGEGIVQSAFCTPEQTMRLLKRLCADLTTPSQLVAPRRLRFNCRVVKHICTRFRRKRPEHHNLTFKHTSFSDILLI
jgi:hypothetical protein